MIILSLVQKVIESAHCFLKLAISSQCGRDAECPFCIFVGAESGRGAEYVDGILEERVVDVPYAEP